MWIVRGVASIVFGVLTILWPGASVTAMVYLFGIYALSDGALLLGFASQLDEGKGPYIFRGLLSVAAGVLTFMYPGPTAASLYILIAAWAIAVGATELWIAIALRKEVSVGGLVFAGLASIACGVALLALPKAGIVALVSLIAAYAVVGGIALISAGVRIHNFVRPASAA
jgi:uncharacterized membrane protein HdeD (DUF308 family)